MYTNSKKTHSNDYYINRRLRNKKRRTAQLRRRYLMSAMIIAIVLVLSGAVGGFISRAQSPDEETQYKYYTHITVAYGETLWSIADQYMSEEYESKEAYINEIVQINNIDNENELYAGNTIVVPYYSNEFKWLKHY